MKNLFFLLALLSFAACDSQKNAASSTTTESQPTAEVATNPEPSPELAGKISIDELDARYPQAKKAYFAGGCFWCTEAAFHRIQGVKDAWSGYAGGQLENPTYRQANGTNRHAETVVVYYDPEVIDYDKLLDIFFVSHNPTQVDRQGPDVGPQYRSAIFPLNEEQRTAAEAKIATLNESDKYDKPIATTIEDPVRFWVAEPYHQDYYEDPTNPNQGYVQNVSRPKVEKVMKEFKDILKPEFK